MHVDGEKLAEHCIKAAIGVAVLFTITSWGDWLFIAITWLMVYPLALLIGFVMGFVLNALGAEVEVEEAHVWANDDEEKSAIVEKSPEIIGRFMDGNIHEWVMLKRPDNGELIRLNFERCVDLNKEWDPPEQRWFAVIDGGVLYVQPEKTVGESPAAA